jgi:hypothetical protein
MGSSQHKSNSRRRAKRAHSDRRHSRVTIYAQRLAQVRQELRGHINLLEWIQSHVIVARMALDGQNAEQDSEISVLLRISDTCAPRYWHFPKV